jgi:probable F420-dependent oxidoreductase
VQFIYQYPETHGADADMLDAGSIGEVAAAAEAAGWSGFALTEHPIPGARWLESGGHQTLDPFVGLAHAAALTQRLRLLTNLAVVPYRNPFLLARAAASLDKLSNGRFILGAGTGYLKTEFHALGVDFEERNALFDEALEVLPMFWSGRPFSYRGRHFDARDVVALPRPVQNPIPVWIGGNSRLTLRRVASRAQGWLPLLSDADISALTRTPNLASVSDLATRIGDLREMAGTRAAALDVAASYSDPTITAPGTDTARHRDAFGQLEAAGVTWVIAQGPVGSLAASREFIDAFATTYIT